MLFNSNEFLKFLAAFFLFYYLVRNDRRARNLLVIAGSYLFYGWWDWRFLGLIIISTLLDYFVGIGLASQEDPRRRRILVLASVAGNLSILGFFKYYDFFVESLRVLLGKLGVSMDVHTLGIVLPVGISFYTFQTMSYTLDVYRRRVPATRDLGAFAAYVAFFPQLVAGPIERAHNLLPQFLSVRRIDSAKFASGIWLLVWGMFKKVVVADNLAPLVQGIYDTAGWAPGPSGPAVILATLAFGMQIYCDFSGYSDIARGVARMLGFELMLNFNLPYAAGNLRDFWRRWHISLSTWLRDYLYISLGGNRRGRGRTLVNIMLTMLLGGLWHGAAWHFVFWGGWHGLGLSLQRIFGRGRRGAPAWGLLSWLLTMSFVYYGWLLFRAHGMVHAATLTMALGDWRMPPWIGSYGLDLVVFSLPVICVQFLQARRGRLEDIPVRGRVLRIVLEGILLYCIALYWGRAAVPFIYFQF